MVPLPPEHPAVTAPRIPENRAENRVVNRVVNRRFGFRLSTLPSSTACIVVAGLAGWSARTGMTDTNTMDTDMMKLF